MGAIVFLTVNSVIDEKAIYQKHMDLALRTLIVLRGAQVISPIGHICNVTTKTKNAWW
jgi:hypothetical protein